MLGGEGHPIWKISLLQINKMHLILLPIFQELPGGNLISPEAGLEGVWHHSGEADELGGKPGLS